MTYNDLSKDILSLLGESEVTKPLLIFSVNRALCDIYARRAIYRTVKLYQGGIQPSYYRKEIYCKGGDDVTLPLTGKAYSMRLSGEGFYRINDGAKSTITEFRTGRESRLVRGVIENGGDIKFYGYASFMVFDFSLYEEIPSTKLDELPDGREMTSLDIRTLHDDFYAFAFPAKDGYGNPIKGSVLRDGRLEVPKDFRGEIELTYRTLPKKILEMEDAEKEGEQQIPIPPEYEHPLALLVAFYCTLVKNPAAAELMRLEYERIMTLGDKNLYEEIDTSYELKVRWA